MIGKVLIAFGVWLLCDAIISIRIYYNKLAETGGRKQNWKYDHSIRVIRGIIALCMVGMGFYL